MQTYFIRECGYCAHFLLACDFAYFLMYFVTSFCGILNMSGVLSVVVSGRAVFYRERASKTYLVEPYNIGMFVAELPYLLLTSFLFVVIMYYMVGFRDTRYALFFYWATFFLYIAMMTYLGQLLGVLLPSLQIAQGLGSVIATIWNLFCGFLIPKPNIPTFWIWLYWTSPIRYALEALAVTQFYCDINDPAANCKKIVVSGSEVYQWTYVNSTLGFDYDLRWVDLLALLLFTSAFRVAAFFALKYVKHISR